MNNIGFLASDIIIYVQFNDFQANDCVKTSFCLLLLLLSNEKVEAQHKLTCSRISCFVMFGLFTHPIDIARIFISVNDKYVLHPRVIIISH